MDFIGDLNTQHVRPDEWMNDDGWILKKHTHSLPSFHLLVIPYPRNVLQRSSLLSNKSTFRDQQRPRFTRTLTVILDGKIPMDACIVGAETGKWGEDDAMLEGDGGCKLEWCEKLLGGHFIGGKEGGGRRDPDEVSSSF